jgi:hypothetical protein
VKQTIEDILSKPTCSVDEARKVLGIGKGGAYEDIRTGKIAHIRRGRRILVLTEPLKRTLAGAA